MGLDSASPPVYPPAEVFPRLELKRGAPAGSFARLSRGAALT